MGFAVIHETPLGWHDSEDSTSDVTFGNEAFPYGAQLSTSEASQAASGGSGGGQAGADQNTANAANSV